ncbi:MAG: DUF362 domain-containing protein [Candidatus Natronoplasma sp.]
MEVFIDRCSDYSSVKEVIEEAFASLGGLDTFVKDGETILVKPNLLQASEPSKNVITHPNFVRAVIEVLEKKDIEIIVGDSPGGRMSEGKLKKLYEKSEYLKLEEETSAKLNYNTESEKISYDGRIKKSFEFLELSQEVDGIINLPKLKTHSLTVFTGAVKNSYGLIHGLNKAAYHGQFKKLNDFGKLLLDISDAVSPRLSLMDGIWAMEGDGPSSGDPIKTECVIASKDPVICDHAACKVVGIPDNKVPTLYEADYDKEEIEYIKRQPNSFEKEFEYPSGGSTPWWVPDYLSDFFSNLYLDRPTLNKDSCTQCWECEEICPVGAIKERGYGPKISWLKCIRCYCCSEVCPEEALLVK